MPVVSSKHRQLKPEDISNVLNGMNVAQIPEKLEPNEAQLLQNFEYIGNRLWTRGGLSAPLFTFPANIYSVFYDYETYTYFVFLTSKDVYKYVKGSLPIVLGNAVSGDKCPVCCKYGGKLLIASGGKLQSFTYGNTGLTTIGTSPDCDAVFERFGRVVVTCAGVNKDTVYYSAVGNETIWEDDPNDDSSGKYIDIGYKDGGDIVGITFYASDIIVFKTNGKIFQLKGEFPDWKVSHIGSHSDIITGGGIEQLGNDIVYVSRRGLRTLSTSEDYANFTQHELGEKINIELMKSIGSDMPKTWNIKRKKQLIINPNGGNTLWAYNYSQNAFSVFTFPSNIVEVIESPTEILIAMGNKLYEWSSDYDTDDGIKITAKLVSRKIVSVDNMLTKKVSISVEGDTGSASFKVNSKSIPFLWGVRKSRDYLLQIRSKEFVYQFETTDKMSFNHLLVEIAT